MSWELLYAGYLVWLMAGCLDFMCHRRADLPHTSGLQESLFHLIQMGLIGTMVLAWMWLSPSLALFLLMTLLVLAHAIAGYLDTVVAWRHRSITPLEQHLHSVLDTAPCIMLLAVVLQQGASALAAGWGWGQRTPAFPISAWIAVMGPALVLCAMPLVHELRSAWRARCPSGKASAIG